MNTETDKNEVAEVLGGADTKMALATVPCQVVQLDTGNFSVILAGTPKADTLAKYVRLGMTYDLQRTPITKAYLGLVGIPGKKVGTLKFPEGFERDDVEYTEENAEVIRAKVAEFFGEVLDDLKVSVMFHEKGVDDDNRKKARGVLVKWKAAGLVEKKITLWEAASDVEFEGDTENDEDVVNFIHRCIIKPE